MAAIVDLQEQRRLIAAKRGFQGWSRRFSESFDVSTCANDLSDITLAVLIQGGEEASMPLYELITGVLGLGGGVRFYYLENRDKMAVMDIALFILDRLRFEAMRRLGWVSDDPTFHIPLIDLIQQFSTRFSTLSNQTPALSVQHSGYKEYVETFEGDRPSFIRRLIPEAIDAFVKMSGKESK